MLLLHHSVEGGTKHSARAFANQTCCCSLLLSEDASRNGSTTTVPPLQYPRVVCLDHEHSSHGARALCSPNSLDTLQVHTRRNLQKNLLSGLRNGFLPYLNERKPSWSIDASFRVLRRRAVVGGR